MTAAGLRCVLYDRRGHGRSDRPAAGYDLDTLADDLAAVLDHFGLHEASLVAHSLGSRESHPLPHPPRRCPHRPAGAHRTDHAAAASDSRQPRRPGPGADRRQLRRGRG
ncbi:MAG TPA: alpha/beta fold hydrolase [Streptosporangiaceae bacterium]|nr:alpha/beta fold hydrolase [Streptosporangiaceae bacterium]